MNRKSLCALLKSNSNIDWKDRCFHSSKGTVKWMSVFNYECSAGVSHCIGLSDAGVWCAEYSDQIHVTDPDKSFLFVTILEMERSVFIQKIRESLSILTLPENVLKTFPFDDLMLVALRHNGHWGRLAEKWLEGGYPLSAEIILEFPDLKFVQWEQKRRIEEIINA